METFVFGKIGSDISTACVVLLCLVSLAACTTVESSDQKVTGAPPLCAPGVQLGKVVVAPLSHWRVDQKEPRLREGIAKTAIENAFAGLPCATSIAFLAFQPDQAKHALAANAKAGGAGTLVTITVRELGPIVLMSVPVLWSGWSDVVFDFEAIDIETGATRLAVSRHRKVGGAFDLRGLGPLQGEFENALKPLLIGL